MKLFICRDKSQFKQLEETRKGFTLLEVMISLAILSALLVVIIQSNTETTFFLRRTDQLATAQKVVINELMRIERDNSTTLSSAEGTFAEDHVMAANKWKLTIENSNFLGAIPITRVQYQVFWLLDNQQHSYEASIIK